MQLSQKKARLREDLLISALSLDSKVLLDDLTDEKIKTIESLAISLVRPSSQIDESNK